MAKIEHWINAEIFGPQVESGDDLRESRACERESIEIGQAEVLVE